MNLIAYPNSLIVLLEYYFLKPLVLLEHFLLKPVVNVLLGCFSVYFSKQTLSLDLSAQINGGPL